MLFYKGVDHMRCLTPPMRETDEDAVVFGPVLCVTYIIRAQGRIIVFFLNTAVFVIVVQII